MKGIIPGALLILASAVGPAAQQASAVPQAEIDRALAESWKGLSPEMQARIDQDEAMRLCSVHRNDVPASQAEQLTAAAKASIVYPADGKFMGDWKKGEQGSLSGFGFRMGDDMKRPAGGNCYACHQLSPKEISYGTLGPSLLGYAKMKGDGPEVQKEVYEKIFNSQAMLACSNMPRFGHNRVLTPEAIKDYVAYLLDPASPVNKGQ